MTVIQLCDLIRNLICIQKFSRSEGVYGLKFRLVCKTVNFKIYKTIHLVLRFEMWSPILRRIIQIAVAQKILGFKMVEVHNEELGNFNNSSGIVSLVEPTSL